MDSQNGITKQGKQPWYEPKVNYLFNQITTLSNSSKQNAVIMDSIMWSNLPPLFKGLKNRINIVVSENMQKQQLNEENVTGANIYINRSLSKAIRMCSKSKKVQDIFIIGSINLLKNALEKRLIDEIFYLKLKINYRCDVFYPFDVWENLIMSDKIETITTDVKMDGDVWIIHEKFTFTNKCVECEKNG